MLDTALKFIAREVNAHLLTHTGSAFGQVALGPVVDDAGKWVVADDTVQLTLVQVEREHTSRNAPPERVHAGSTLALKPAPLQINALVLFSASFVDYELALRQLSHVLTFFHEHPVFDAAGHTGLPQALERLIVEFVDLTPGHMHQLWSTLGGKHLPSVVYRLRMVALQDGDPASTGAPTMTIDAELLHG